MVISEGCFVLRDAAMRGKKRSAFASTTKAGAGAGVAMQRRLSGREEKMKSLTEFFRTFKCSNIQRADPCGAAQWPCRADHGR